MQVILKINSKVFGVTPKGLKTQFGEDPVRFKQAGLVKGRRYGISG